MKSMRETGRISAVLLSTIGLAHCTPPGYAAEIISGDPQQVSIKAGPYANPGPMAIEHCSKIGKTAVLQDARDGVYRFACQ